jgi:hypothetical protein
MPAEVDVLLANFLLCVMQRYKKATIRPKVFARARRLSGYKNLEWTENKCHD